jgi:hypothetical protein
VCHKMIRLNRPSADPSETHDRRKLRLGQPETRAVDPILQPIPNQIEDSIHRLIRSISQARSERTRSTRSARRNTRSTVTPIRSTGTIGGCIRSRIPIGPRTPRRGRSRGVLPSPGRTARAASIGPPPASWLRSTRARVRGPTPLDPQRTPRWCSRTNPTPGVPGRGAHHHDEVRCHSDGSGPGRAATTPASGPPARTSGSVPIAQGELASSGAPSPGERGHRHPPTTRADGPKVAPETRSFRPAAGPPLRWWLARGGDLQGPFSTSPMGLGRGSVPGSHM